jgi:hypothetical protein
MDVVGHPNYSPKVDTREWVSIIVSWEIGHGTDGISNRKKVRGTRIIRMMKRSERK